MARRRPPTNSVDYEEPQGLPGEDAERKRLGFFDYMATLDKGDLEHCLVYIYRQDPAIRNPEGTGNYIEKAVPPIDEQYLRDKWGGGQYLLHLKNVKERRLLRTCVFKCEGTAKIATGTVLVDNKGAPIDAPAGQGTASPITANDLGAVFTKALEMMRSENKPAGDALTSAMEVLGQAQKGAMEIVISSAKSLVADKSEKVDPIDNFIKMAEALKNMQGITSNERKSSVAELKDAFSAVREVSAILTGGEQGGDRRTSNSLLDEVRALVELKKADTDGSLLGMVLKARGGDDEEPASAWNTVAKLGMQLVEKRPDVLGSLADLIGGLASRLMATPATLGQPPTTLAGTPAPPAAIAPATPAQPVPTILPPENKQPAHQEQIMLEDFLRVVARGYRSTLESEGEANGDAVAMSVLTIFPDLVPMIKAQLEKYDDVMITGWMQTQKPTAEIAAMPQFAQFLADFRATLFEPLEAEQGDTTADAGGAKADAAGQGS
jgi:hypothetical protein